MPARTAASTLFLTPPMGSTSPRSEISPVMAVSLLTVLPVSRETSEVNMATPALGPSLGMPPAGTWTWMSDFSNRAGSTPSVEARGFTTLLHAPADLPGKDQSAAARHARRLDEEDVAAGRRPGEPGGDPRHAR